MNVFFLTSWFPSRVHAINGVFIGRHARLVAKEHRLTVVALEVDEALKTGRIELTERKEEGYTVVHAYVGHTNATPGPVKTLLRFLAYQKALRRARKLSGKPDLLHGHVLLDGGIATSLWSLFWNVPFVLTEHSTAYHKSAALPGFRGWLGRYACRKATVVMPVSDHLGRSMQEKNGLAGNYRSLSNVVDEQLYHLEPPPKTPPFCLLHVSSFNERSKNITGLLRAFTLLEQDPDQPVTLHFAGCGDLVELQEMIDATGHQGVTCSGPHTEAEVAQLMQGCHAFILFSNYENQPVVLLEAQMSGRPCITTPVGGIPDIVLPGEIGLFVPVRDEAALAAAIIEMRDNYANFDLEAIRKRAVGEYSEAAVSQALNQVYSMALE